MKFYMLKAKPKHRFILDIVDSGLADYLCARTDRNYKPLNIRCVCLYLNAFGWTLLMEVNCFKF